jgi:heptosyltransferase-3
MKTFIYHNGALGDVLLSLPCLKRLRASSGWAYLAGRGDVVRFIRDTGLADATASSDQKLFASLHSAIDSKLLTFLGGFDRAYIFTAAEYSDAAAAIRQVIPRFRTIRTIPPEGSKMHVAHYRFSQLEPGVQLRDGDAVLRLPSEESNTARSLLREAGYSAETGLIAIHPGSGSRLKCWPLERYFELIEYLQSVNDAFVILFTGEAEDAKIRKAVCSYSKGRKNVFHAADLDLMSAATLLSHCVLYLGNDSGFSHLAGLLGCITIVLFGPTNPLLWRPLGPRVEVVSTDTIGPITHIPLNEVIEKIESAVAGVRPNHERHYVPPYRLHR